MPDITTPPPGHLVEDRGHGRTKLGVLISGSGTNLQAIIDASATGALEADVAVVVSDKAGAHGLVRARNAGIPAVHIDRSKFCDVTEFNRELARVLLEHGVDLVVMAGYMRLLGRRVLEAFPMRVMNLHPALLPAFPGAHGIRDAFEHGVKVTGVTVHFADFEFDNGPIIAQEPVVIAENDTLETLEARIHEVEHRIYPRAIQLFAEGRLEVEGRKVHVLPKGA